MGQERHPVLDLVSEGCIPVDVGLESGFRGVTQEGVLILDSRRQ